ncbi:MAG: hypothetical protein ACRCXD_03525, partial [Luteolibacter sp.]
MPNRTRTTILTELRRVIRIYTQRGFYIRDVHADGEFACIADILPVVLDVVPADSHVGAVERSIRTIKERLRSCVHGLPFRRLPRLIIDAMVTESVRCLNQFPWPHGISSDLSPNTLVTGAPCPDYNSMRLEFGSYAQIFDDATPTNTIRSRCLGAIALHATGNAAGDYYFLSLASGRRVSRHQWTLLPLTDAAIGRVEALAFYEGQPLIQDSGLVVEWRHDHLPDPDVFDADFVPPPDPDDTFPTHLFDRIDPTETADLLDDAATHGLDMAPPPDYPAADPGALHDAEQWILQTDDISVNTDNDNDEDPDPDDPDARGDNADPNLDDRDEHDIDDTDDIDPNNIDNNVEPQEPHVPDDNDQGAHVVQGADTIEDDPPVNNRPTAGRYNLRERTAPAPRFHNAMAQPHDRQSYFPPPTDAELGRNKTARGFTLNQMTARAGIKKHGTLAETALIEEFT